MSSVYVTCCTTKSKPLLHFEDFKQFYINLTDVGGDGQPERAWHFDAGHHGRISILSRWSGFEYRDIETGYRDTWSMVARGCDNYGKNFGLHQGIWI
jgi:hypothetical protein